MTVLSPDLDRYVGCTNVVGITGSGKTQLPMDPHEVGDRWQMFHLT